MDDDTRLLKLLIQTERPACEHETCQRSQNLSEDEKGGVGVSGQRRAAAVVELLLRDAGLCTTLARALLHC